jgi:hypothetical protein
MEQQTDGIEWVLATLFVLGFVAVIVSAIIEIRKYRQGDPNDVESERGEQTE